MLTKCQRQESMNMSARLCDNQGNGRGKLNGLAQACAFCARRKNPEGPKYQYGTKYGFCSCNFPYGLGKYSPYGYLGPFGEVMWIIVDETVDEGSATQVVFILSNLTFWNG